MDNFQKKELATLIDKYSNIEGVNETIIPGVSLFRASTTDIPLPSVYNPSLCFIVQGHKQVILDKEIYHYGSSEYLIVSVELPLTGKITNASKDKPYFVVKIDIDLLQLSELLIQSGHPVRKNSTTKRGLFIGRADNAMGDCVLRLVRLLDRPEDIPVLASQTIREILYRVMRSDYGETLAQIVLKGSNMHRIASAIQEIQNHFHEKISVNYLAKIAGMSVSSFHAHFKSVTAMSPLQFQKSLRLMEARTLMTTQDIDAESTAYQVGYGSASQFSREYARMFGNPPKRDIKILVKNCPSDGNRQGRITQ